MFKVIGTIHRVVGPIVHVTDIQDVKMLELVEVGDERLVGEVVRLAQNSAVIQVYEDTTGIKPGAPVYGSGCPLSVELGPGLLGSIYDGIQRPLETIKKQSGSWAIPRGIHVPALDRKRKWDFAAAVKTGDKVTGGQVIGSVQETETIRHMILVPPAIKEGVIVKLAASGKFTVEETLGIIRTGTGEETKLGLMQTWPVRITRPYRQKLPIQLPLVTGQRVIDTLFPVGKGGCVIVPGGFGTGKTMTQQAIAKFCDADIILYIGCGERGNEITDVLKEFPEIIDPRTNKPLMNRTVIIANTSNMPVAAREASIYTGITIAEYYRDMGYHLAILADSTSRWAEALRELSGRMEEMPADEGFPAYLPTKLAEFYERGGYVQTLGGKEGSISLIGAVSPPGGDFSEPVTQHSKRFIRSFWALDRDLANARHYPAISWLDSYSEYIDDISAWWEENASAEWRSMRRSIMELLQIDNKLSEIVKLIGPDALPESQRIVLETCTLFKNAFLQQNSYDAIDRYCVAAKQVKMLKAILTFHSHAVEALKKGVTLIQIKGMKLFGDIMKMKFTVPNEQHEKIDALIASISLTFEQMEKKYAQFEQHISTL